MRRVRSDELERMQEDVARLEPWSQNLHLPGGIQTAPAHPRGDWPALLWRRLGEHVDADLSGKTVLDVGCNAGHHCFEMARRGAEVLGIDPDPHALEQARWARKKLGLHNQVRFRRMQVYDLAQYERTFDIVLCLGAFPHMRYPMLALDLLARKCRGTFLFRSMRTPGSKRAPDAVPDLSSRDLGPLERDGWPSLSFVPGSIDGDATNWWVPNQEAVVAMLVSAGFDVQRRLDGELYLCSVASPPRRQWHEAEVLSATGRPWRKQGDPRFPRQDQVLVRA